ncbi:hypothetical protein TYRP_015486 [Tyrophagus putrescentiae]|nr:hypothetical protein TYRP_015486 [Tyrophagus putrescentiae]
MMKQRRGPTPLIEQQQAETTLQRWSLRWNAHCQLEGGVMAGQEGTVQIGAGRSAEVLPEEGQANG